MQGIQVLNVVFMQYKIFHDVGSEDLVFMVVYNNDQKPFRIE